MNELKVFNSTEFGEIGVLTIDGKEYFPATACAKILGYVNPYKAIKDHCRGVTKREGVSFTTNQHGVTSKQTVTTNYIPEGDLYRLIVRSKLPAAERFERWVFDEVLPELRKRGTYTAPGAQQSIPLEQVTQIIQMTATAMMTEFVKQVVPILRKEVPAQGPASTTREETITTTVVTEKKRKYIPAAETGKVEKLPDTLRDEVDKMLGSGATYRAVSEFLLIKGHPVSQMAVHRYYHKYFN